MTSTNIVIERTAERIARITLDRPERRNALSLELLGELRDALNDLGTDAHVAVVIIDGSGPAFSAGHDLNEMLDREEAFYEELFGTCTEVMLAVQGIPQPVIAQVHGAATAAGCQLVAACDIAVAADDAWFATPGVRIGLFCSTPMVPITRAIGRKRAFEMLLTGRPIDATTAREWGLVNRVVPAIDLADATEGLAAEIMEFSSDVIGIGKAAFYEQIARSDADAYDITGPIMSANASHRDAQEGMSAFLEKRPPRWSTS
jgi:enoyl-CoA hydratase/carnithine racemase